MLLCWVLVRMRISPPSVKEDPVQARTKSVLGSFVRNSSSRSRLRKARQRLHCCGCASKEWRSASVQSASHSTMHVIPFLRMNQSNYLGPRGPRQQLAIVPRRFRQGAFDSRAQRRGLFCGFCFKGGSCGSGSVSDERLRY